MSTWCTVNPMVQYRPTNQSNFWVSKLLWLQIVPNIRPVDNSCLFDAFSNMYCEIICFELWQNWVLTPYLIILCSNQYQKKVRTITGGSWWTQIKVVLIQKGQLDNQNPNFCMGWPGFYLLDNINQLGSLWEVGSGINKPHEINSCFCLCVCFFLYVSMQ